MRTIINQRLYFYLKAINLLGKQTQEKNLKHWRKISLTVRYKFCIRHKYVKLSKSELVFAKREDWSIEINPEGINKVCHVGKKKKKKIVRFHHLTRRLCY